jgi:hypothetical protein
MTESHCNSKQISEWCLEHGRGLVKDEPRLRFLTAMFSIAVEHHSAILLLIEHGHMTGSAFAPVRPLQETVCRGAWGYFCASEEQLGQIVRHDKYPKFHVMAALIDSTLNAEGVFLNHIDTFPILSGYTHSGMHQIGRRFDANRDLQPTYTEEAIKEVENICAAMVATIGFMFLKETGRPEMAVTLGQLYKKLYPSPREPYL